MSKLISIYTGLARAAAVRGLALQRLAREYPTERAVFSSAAVRAFRAARAIGGAR